MTINTVKATKLGFCQCLWCGGWNLPIIFNVLLTFALATHQKNEPLNPLKFYITGSVRLSSFRKKSIQNWSLRGKMLSVCPKLGSHSTKQSASPLPLHHLQKPIASVTDWQQLMFFKKHLSFFCNCIQYRWVLKNLLVETVVINFFAILAWTLSIGESTSTNDQSLLTEVFCNQDVPILRLENTKMPFHPRKCKFFQEGIWLFIREIFQLYENR